MPADLTMDGNGPLRRIFFPMDWERIQYPGMIAIFLAPKDGTRAGH
jgi:hypothetical protein